MNQGQWRKMEQPQYAGHGEEQYYETHRQDVQMEEGAPSESLDDDTPRKKLKPWERLGRFQMMHPAQQQQVPQGKVESTISNVTAHLTRTVQPAPAPVKEGAQQAVSLKPISEKKQNPVAQQVRHPLMILQQLYPSIKYTTAESVAPGTTTKCYTVTAVINDQEFSQDAPSIKKAKFLLAKTALKAVYDIDNVYGTRKQRRQLHVRGKSRQQSSAGQLFTLTHPY